MALHLVLVSPSKALGLPDLRGLQALLGQSKAENAALVVEELANRFRAGTVDACPQAKGIDTRELIGLRSDEACPCSNPHKKKRNSPHKKNKILSVFVHYLHHGDARSTQLFLLSTACKIKKGGKNVRRGLLQQDPLDLLSSNSLLPPCQVFITISRL